MPGWTICFKVFLSSSQYTIKYRCNTLINYSTSEKVHQIQTTELLTTKHWLSLGSNITEAGDLPPSLENTVILSNTRFFLFKTSSHGLFESNLYCIDFITTEHVDYFLKRKMKRLWTDDMKRRILKELFNATSKIVINHLLNICLLHMLNYSCANSYLFNRIHWLLDSHNITLLYLLSNFH